jgi:DNA-directed RNA polymerase
VQPAVQSHVQAVGHEGDEIHGLALQSRDGVSRKTLSQVVEFAMANWQQIVASAELAPHTGAPQKGNKAFE